MLVYLRSNREIYIPTSRTAESSESHERLVAEGEGNIIRKQRDYGNRLEMTSAPIKKSYQHSMCFLNSYVNIFGWLCKVLCRCNQSYECCIEKKAIIGEDIRVRHLTLSAPGRGGHNMPPIPPCRFLDRCILTGRALDLILYDFSSNFILNMWPVKLFWSVI